MAELLADSAVGSDTSLFVPKLAGVGGGISSDFARPGVHGIDAAVSSDSGLVIPKFVAVDAAAAADAVSVRAYMGCADTGLGSDSATCGFSPKAAALTSYATPATYQYRIPVWCRYIDVVLLGAGGGGASSGTFYTLGGYPGEAGVYATVTLERGVHIPWAAIFITLTVGTGGARGSGGFTGTAGSAGGSTILTYTNAAGSPITVTATGGAGGIANLTGTSDNTGRSPGNRTYNGQPYTGGAAQSTAGSDGNPPGGGGAGGRNFGGAGGVGAPGGAWCRAYQ
ncbi:hypothetical protein ACFV6Y_39165 [Streptomyces massasporeus]|uniref:glycine-rich domain-containing protein n=1 Tax=Streptomyces massasporeus TaxID=67324 RepID=UPI0036621595